MNNFLLSDDIDLNSLLQNYTPFLALFVILVISIVADKGLSVFERFGTHYLIEFMILLQIPMIHLVNLLD